MNDNEHQAIVNQLAFARNKLCEAQKSGDLFPQEAWHGYSQALQWVLDTMSKDYPRKFPTLYCPRCNAIGPVGDPNWNEPPPGAIQEEGLRLRCVKCWTEGYSVIPLQGSVSLA